MSAVIEEVSQATDEVRIALQRLLPQLSSAHPEPLPSMKFGSRNSLLQSAKMRYSGKLSYEDVKKRSKNYAHSVPSTRP